jgi:hypothetical protein
VILDAREDRFAASIRALEHGFTTYDRTNLVIEGERYARADVPYRRGETVGLVAKWNVEGLIDESPEVHRETKVFEELPESAKRGTTRRGYDGASLWERVWFAASSLWK